MESTANQTAPSFTERNAGIEEYLSKESLSISCSIKHRYSDFIVNEINQAGEVVWFRPETIDKWRQSNFRNTLPKNVLEKLAQIEEEEKLVESDLMVPNAEAVEVLKELVGEEDSQKFFKFT